MANCTRLERAECPHGAYCETFSVHEDPSECRKLRKQQPTKPMTNADRIRAMGDEELEPTILAFKLGYAPWCDHHCKNEGEYGCDTCILNWLKQPAEGECV